MSEDRSDATDEGATSGATTVSPRPAGTSRGRSTPGLTNRRVTLSLTFVVAFCSIVYELVYSEFLTVFFGGTVLRYSITIGLYMFSLGIGAFLSTHFDDPERNFLRTEIYLAVAGPAGAAFIVLLNSFPHVAFPEKGTIILLAAHLPILLVGLLSGFEIPLLNDLVENREETLFAALGRSYPRRIVRNVLGAFFTLDEPEGRSFSEVLGVDYIGSLAGTVGYALFLYPRYGLVVTALALGLLNALAALAFAAWTLSDGDIARPARRSWRVMVVVCLLLSGSYAGLVVNGGAVDRAVTNAYLADRIESEYQPDQAAVEVVSTETTAYQRVTRYERDLSFHAGTETCLRLDGAVQLCDNWVEPYHGGLVDVPMTMYEDPESVDVLLVGGGDYIAVDHLRAYNASVHQVDIDGQFLNHTRDRQFYEQYHDDAYEYDRLNTTVGDAYTYLRTTDTEYDLILLDVPGARSDDSLPLYSVEFYRLLRSHLSERGVVVTWTYSQYLFAEHHKAYMNTVRSVGFDRYMTYSVYSDLDGDGESERGERFYVLSDGPTPTPNLSQTESSYVREHRGQFNDWEWQATPRYRGVEPNSVFSPNYDIIVDL